MEDRSLNKVIGHDAIIGFLERTARSGSHAYLLVGPEHIGKATLVRWLTARLQCKEVNAPCGTCVDCQQVQQGVHQDVWWVARQESAQDISIAQVRELQQFVSLASLSGSTRVVVIDGAEQLNQESGNALLKVLEEPPERMLFFLVAHEPSAVLPTIRSRCFMLYLSPVAESVTAEWLTGLGARSKKATELSRLSGGRPGMAIRLLQDEEAVLARYEAAKIFVTVVRGGWPQLQNYLNKELKGEDITSERERAGLLMNTWLEFAHDVMVVCLQEPSLVRYQAMEEEINGLAREVSVSKTLFMIERIREAQRKLSMNGHVRLTLEWLAYNLHHHS